MGYQYDRCQGYDCENCYSDIITTECSENHHDVRDINMMQRHYQEYCDDCECVTIHEYYQGYHYRDCYSDIVTREWSGYQYNARSTNVVRDTDMIHECYQGYRYHYDA